MNAYTMRNFRMANSTIDFLAREEACKSSRIEVTILQGNGNAVLPNETLCTRKQVLQKLVLATKFHVDDSVSQTWSTTSLKDLVDTNHRISCILDSLKLGVAVHGFGSRTLHDNMDRAALVVADKASLAAKELDKFLLCDRVWDL